MCQNSIEDVTSEKHEPSTLNTFASQDTRAVGCKGLKCLTVKDNLLNLFCKISKYSFYNIFSRAQYP